MSSDPTQTMAYRSRQLNARAIATGKFVQAAPEPETSGVDLGAEDGETDYERFERAVAERDAAAELPPGITPLELARAHLTQASQLRESLRTYRAEVEQRIEAGQRELVEIDKTIAALPGQAVTDAAV